MLEVNPDLAIPFPESGAKLSDFKEKVEAACRTLNYLGIEEELPSESDQEIAEKALYELIEDVENQPQLLKTSQNFRPATYGLVNELIKEYSVRVVDNATQIRLLVTNKLLLESDNPDPKVRMRALELLGKITDVGLFTEKSEVTVTHRSTEDLINNVRAKIAALREPKDITPVPPPIEGEVIDVDAELGL